MQHTIGEVLKSERKRQNLTLDDIQQKSKVQKRYLQLIENDQFDLLPSAFYTRAFIRQYARALSIPDAPLVDAFTNEDLVDLEAEANQSDKAIQIPSEKKINDAGMVEKQIDHDNIEIAAEKQSKKQPSRVTRHPRSWLDHLPAIILSLFAIVIIAVVILVVVQQNSGNDTSNSSYSVVSSSESSTQSQASSSASTAASSSEEAVKENQIKIASTESNTITVTATDVTEPAKLTITASDTGRSWVSILDNTTQANLLGYTGTNGNVIGNGEAGGMTQEATLSNTNQSVKVTIGNKPNIAVTLNGQAIDLTSTTNTVVYLVINISYKS
ncbi:MULTISPECIES: helix-turn-helix domain-containing protein [unclassified Enterococcus]|uniref:helix-turn-helix domain-containing protein n=1 Tax=unclassified Enterococcus TaxID=2608891 RepID=UPI0015554583|nr:MULTISPECIES: helix-turn-helix domain-containing protein [unclassified Enterococcus]MBS7577893.1 helix-turn-helix domain-containing protein [Enterococcus sp. MMGLQ5-2]MBS7585246.1 helix-turn-helix domain-containing protein [Enterococcus sp. MMGLQ5-1]NPD13103.1 hypothetical protein [Enterococcus sp. MMGLQ5-1]NPD37723.1 hypothetical protein [Enterococcus sp. MMGLQ5-2]